MPGAAASPVPTDAPPAPPASRPAPAADGTAPVAAFVRARFVDLFLGQSRRAQIGLLAAGALVAWVWHARTQQGAALAWIAALAIVTLLRVVFSERFVRAAAPAAQPLRIALLLGANGLLMMVPLAAFASLSEIERAAVSIILIGSATASVATTSGYRSVFLAFAAPMLLALAAAWALTPHAAGSGVASGSIALLVFLYLLFLVGVGRQAQEVFEESSRFRHGEEQRSRELKQALAAADEANRAKTQFLAAASHDLRQPIHGMNVLVAALSLRELDDRSREIVALLDSVNQMLSRQLDGLLDVSKLDAGIVRPEPAAHRLDRLLEAQHAALAPVARERGITLHLRCDGPAAAITDATLLARVLANLGDNALKYTPAGGTVTLALRAEGGDALISVADTGIGIPADEQERVFREFYQVGNAGRDRTRGLGLGLAIVRRLCELLGVRLTLQSAPGAGTTVTLRLHALAVRVDPTRAPAPAALRPGLAVLVVDDEPLVRESMRLLLDELRCRVHVAESSHEAEAIARAQPLDAVLSDFRLRDGDSGVAALHAVLRHCPGARCALVTGDTAPDRIRDAQAAGVALLHKPVTLPDLLALLGPAAPAVLPSAATAAPDAAGTAGTAGSAGSAESAGRPP